MKQEGMLITCDRCGASIFLQFVREDSRDGGFSPSARIYEELPDAWLYTTQMGYLCPSCSEQFRSFVTIFMDGKVAPSWKTVIVKDG